MAAAANVDAGRIRMLEVNTWVARIAMSKLLMTNHKGPCQQRDIVLLILSSGMQKLTKVADVTKPHSDNGHRAPVLIRSLLERPSIA